MGVNCELVQASFASWRMRRGHRIIIIMKFFNKSWQTQLNTKQKWKWKTAEL